MISSEVAAVLSHEIAHVTANHAIERQNKARNAVIVSRVVTDVLDDDDGKLALASTQRTLASFSRQQELEADAIGVKTIGRAGYDPFAAARFLSAMSRFGTYRTTTGTLDKRPDFLASHPTTPERVEFATRAARQFGAPGVGEIDRDRYLGGIDGIVYGDDPSQGYVRARSYVHPSLGIGFSVPAGFIIDNTSDAVLATGADGTALRFDAVSLAAGADLASYLASGWVNGLIEGSIKTLEVNGMPAAVAAANAKGWVFEIAVVQAPSGATYRFIFANEVKTPGFAAAAAATVKSFRRLSPSEVAALKPLRIRVVMTRAGDSDETMAKRMRGVDRPRELFRALNNLDAGKQFAVGTKVKIVDDQRAAIAHGAREPRGGRDGRRLRDQRKLARSGCSRNSAMRSFSSARFSIWRTRSFEMPMLSPSASSVAPSSWRRRSLTMRSSRSLSTLSAERSQLTRRSLSMASPTAFSGNGTPSTGSPGGRLSRSRFRGSAH